MLIHINLTTLVFDTIATFVSLQVLDLLTFFEGFSSLPLKFYRLANLSSTIDLESYRLLTSQNAC